MKNIPNFEQFINEDYKPNDNTISILYTLAWWTQNENTNKDKFDEYYQEEVDHFHGIGMDAFPTLEDVNDTLDKLNIDLDWISKNIRIFETDFLWDRFKKNLSDDDLFMDAANEVIQAKKEGFKYWYNYKSSAIMTKTPFIHGAKSLNDFDYNVLNTGIKLHDRTKRY